MLDEYLENIGYSNKQTSFFKKTYPISSYSESTLLYNFKTIYNFFKKIMSIINLLFILLQQFPLLFVKVLKI